MTEASYRAFLFDMDGTLVDTDSLQYELWKVILPSLTRDMYETLIRGRTDDCIWENVTTNLGVDIPSEERQRWNTRKQEEFLRRIDETVPIPGGREFMERVYDKRTFIGIVTNSKATVAERLIDRLGIMNFVDVLITADNCPDPKPSPMPYQMAMKQLGVRPEHTVIFEDSLVGIQSALSSGVSRVYVIGQSLFHIKDYNSSMLDSL